MGYTLIAAGATHVGEKREENEDSHLVDLENGLFVVADGMGGHEKGKEASMKAVEALSLIPTGSFQPPSIVEGFALADEEIGALLAETSKGPGTTATLLWIDVNKMGTERNRDTPLCFRTALVGHLGDSRLYQIGYNGAHQITTDHSLIASLVLQGEFEPHKAQGHRLSNIIHRCLVGNGHYWPDLLAPDLNPYDAFLLCSDGLTDMVDLSSAEARKLLRRVKGAESNKDLQEIADGLVDLANRNGGKDNITVILVRMYYKRPD